MKLITVDYFGFTTSDKRFSGSMLPWIIAEIRRRKTVAKICLGVENGTVEAYNVNFEHQFSHKITDILRYSRALHEPQTFMFLTKDIANTVLYCYLFRANSNDDVTELFRQIRDQTDHDGSNSSLTPNGSRMRLNSNDSSHSYNSNNSTSGKNSPNVARKQRIHKPPQRSMSSVDTLTSLLPDISLCSSQFFEVYYEGKMKIMSCTKLPDTVIDDALTKFKQHDSEKMQRLQQRLEDGQFAAGYSSLDDRRSSQESTSSDVSTTELQNRRLSDEGMSSSNEEPAKTETRVKIKIEREKSLSPRKSPTKNKSRSINSNNQHKSMEKKFSRSFDNLNAIAEGLLDGNLNVPQMLEARKKFSSAETLPILMEDDGFDENKNLSKFNTQVTAPVSKSEDASHDPDQNAKLLLRRSSMDHNRTMVFFVGNNDVRLISPDRKRVLLRKQLSDICKCVQGKQHRENFGIICKEAKSNHVTAYVFKCQSESVTTDVVHAITQIFETHKKSIPQTIISCDHCPMVWFHRLCTELENQGDRKTQAIIFRRLAQMDDDERSMILMKFRGTEPTTIREENEFLMMLLRAHCENKQTRHVHDTAENRSEFLSQYLGGGTIFMKAKKSFVNSFDTLLKRKGSRDDFGPILRDMSIPVGSNKLEIPTLPESQRNPITRMTTSEQLVDLSINEKENEPDPEVIQDDTKLKSPMMDIFLQVGSSPKAPKRSICDFDDNTEASNGTQESRDKSRESVQRSSWRQEMFQSVITPDKKTHSKYSSQKRSTEQLRALWKKAIRQALLLVRMERENARLTARQEESAVKRIKLEYDEIVPCERGLIDIWELMIGKETPRTSTKCDYHKILQAIRQGVPRSKRGDVWHYLSHQYCAKHPPIDTTNFPNYNVSYQGLLKQLTEHQHAILIDLARTFPNHTYYSSPLGPGQLALFNLLKAYSLLDPEVGYCQGLSFVAGVLLLHMPEEDAFFLLRHLMFRRGLRKQYLPDMEELQVHLYQLSRLLHDQIPELFKHFHKNDVTPALYAAPWLLTLFASQFPLGFVTRVFDIMFLDSDDVLFRVAIALLDYHKKELLACENFEDILDYLKNTITQITPGILEKVMKQVFASDMKQQLNEYKVEYHVLQEEMFSVKPQLDMLEKVQRENKAMAEKNQKLTEQLARALASTKPLETVSSQHQTQINRLETQVRSMEVTVRTLGQYITSLIDQKVDIDIPNDIAHILSQISQNEQRKAKPPKITMKKIDPHKYMVKSLSMGKLSLNFNANTNPHPTFSLPLGLNTRTSPPTINEDEVMDAPKRELTPAREIKRELKAISKELKDAAKEPKEMPKLQRSASVNIRYATPSEQRRSSILTSINEIENKGFRGFPLKVIGDTSAQDHLDYLQGQREIAARQARQNQTQLSNRNQMRKYPLKTAQSQPVFSNLPQTTEKKSNFFANSQTIIQKQRMSNKLENQINNNVKDALGFDKFEKATSLPSPSLNAQNGNPETNDTQFLSDHAMNNMPPLYDSGVNFKFEMSPLKSLKSNAVKSVKS